MSGNLTIKQFILCYFPDALKLDRRLSWLSYKLEAIRDGKDDDTSYDEALQLEREFDEGMMRFGLLRLESRQRGFSDDLLFTYVRRLNNAFYARLKRLRARVAGMIVKYNSLWFVTLTFSDETLARTSQAYRKRLVKQFLNDYPEYVANIDYGKENEREHYHALVAGNSIIDSNWTKYGFIYNELCLLSDIDSTVPAVSKYVAKLSNHAVKETCKQNYLIYSRSKKNEKKCF